MARQLEKMHEYPTAVGVLAADGLLQCSSRIGPHKLIRDIIGQIQHNGQNEDEISTPRSVYHLLLCSSALSSPAIGIGRP